jgi:SET domain-containing protein
MRTDLEIRHVRGKGRGVFAMVAFYRGQVIEDCPILEFPNEQATYDSVIHHYTFAWNRRRSALALGYGSILNHSFSPNAVYSFRVAKKMIRIRALRNIEPGEEILINYNADPKDKTPLGFDVKG